jgi:hypothetical protein
VFGRRRGQPRRRPQPPARLKLSPTVRGRRCSFVAVTGYRAYRGSSVFGVSGCAAAGGGGTPGPLLCLSPSPASASTVVSEVDADAIAALGYPDFEAL